ncbi:MAG TPA: DUF748 domain-containing protein [Candidatus Binatia bacterium]|jgi:hypothetical protein
MRRRLLIWVGGILAFVLIVIFVLAYLIDEPLRRKVERDMNARLKGYTVRLQKLDFHPIGLSLDLKDLWLYQTAHPDPPIAYIPKLHASVHWKAILFGRLVGDFQIDDPKVHFDLRQFVQEAKDPTPVKDKGWQDALEAAYPLKINRFAIRNGDLTYVDKGPFKPLHVTKLNFTTENIRNVKSEKGVYPSPVELDGVIFDTGKAQFKGDADFLAKPYIAIKGDVELAQITLDYFKPIAERYKFSVRKGTLSTRGTVEYNSEVEKILISSVTLNGLDADYLHQETGTGPTEKVTKEAGKVARETANKSTLEVKVDRLELDGRIGYVNQAAKPPYHVFLDNTKVQVQNLSNHLKEGIARANVTGKFLGSGDTKAVAAFRPENKGPDFDLNVSIENTDMTKMNDLLRAYANIDVVQGIFSLYAEVKVRQGKIDGYVKPLFKDLKVYDRRQDKEKSLFRKTYEALIGGISGLLENRPRQEVATTIPITGDVEAPQTSTWETIVKLIQNAFFKAILPGFEKEISGGAPPTPKAPALTPETAKPPSKTPEKPPAKPPGIAGSPERGPG